MGGGRRDWAGVGLWSWAEMDGKGGGRGASCRAILCVV